MNSQNNHWSSHVEFVVIFITLISGYFMLDGKIDQQYSTELSRMDQVNARIDQVNTRTDQLYQMFIDLLKEGRK
jgi:hypothetical protein